MFACMTVDEVVDHAARLTEVPYTGVSFACSTPCCKSS